MHAGGLLVLAHGTLLLWMEETGAQRDGEVTCRHFVELLEVNRRSQPRVSARGRRYLVVVGNGNEKANHSLQDASSPWGQEVEDAANALELQFLRLEC